MRIRTVLISLAALAWLTACGPQGGDATPPTLLSASPADGATDVALNEAVVLTFSKPVKKLQVTPSPLVGLAAPVWDEARRVVTIAPAPAWPAGTALGFAIVAEDDAGNTRSLDLSFTTLDDQEPPAAPTGLAAEAMDGAIRLTWTANTEPDLAGYLLFWGEDPDAPTGVAALPTAPTEHVLTPLENGTTYAVYLVAEDGAGNRSTPSATLTATPGDTTPPTLVSSQPSDGLRGVGLVTRVRFAFSEPIDPGSLEVFLYQVQAPAEGDPLDPGAPVEATLDTTLLGAPSWSPNGTLVEFDDVAPDLIESDKAYRFQLVAEDLAGNALPTPTTVSFMAGFVPDVIPPEVLGFTQDVDVDTGRGVLTFDFSEPMDQTAAEAAFVSAPAMSCAWAWPTPAQASCTVAGLRQLQSYAVQFTVEARDLMGNGLTAPWNGDFDTLNFKPRLVSFTPAPSRLGLPPRTNDPSQPITWTFSEPVQVDNIAGEVRTGSGALFDTITQARVQLSGDGLTITYYPPSNYNCTGTTYVWRLDRVYEQGSAGRLILSTPQPYSGSFQCGEPGIGTSLQSGKQGAQA